MARAAHVTYTIPVRVHTRSNRNLIEGVRCGTLHVRTTAPPVDGKANKNVTRQLAKAFGVAPSQVRLSAGAAARDKTFVITGSSAPPSWVGQAEFLNYHRTSAADGL